MTKNYISEVFQKILYNPIKTIRDYVCHHYLGVIQLSHSSTGEDVILDWMIQKDNGFYVDVGGFRPIYGNNTYLFYKKGRQGVNIEPNKSGIVQFRKKRPKDINLQIAAGAKNGELDFYVFDYAAISTCDKEAVERYQKSGHHIIDTYTVPIWTLNKIFETYAKNKHIDVLSVDVEGLDMEVLQSNNREKYRPDYIIVETVEYSKHGWEKQSDVFDPYMKGIGYDVIAETGINTIYKNTAK